MMSECRFVRYVDLCGMIGKYILNVSTGADRETVDPTNRPVSYLYLVIICWNEAPGSGRNGRRNRWTDLTEITSGFKKVKPTNT
jgi:hypothetical protein